MEQQQVNEVVESTQTEAAKPEVSAAPTTEGQTPAPELPQYQPNFKFKASDKEYEIDEFVRPVIKDAETEKKIKELYEKAYGMDSVKQHREEIKQKYQSLKSEYEPIKQDIHHVANYIKQQDVFGLVEFLGLKKEDVFKAVKQELDYLQMPAEHKALVDAQRREAMRAQELEKSYMTAQQQAEQHQVEALDYQFQLLMSAPETQSLAQQYESRDGKKPGDFQNALLRHGAAMTQMTGRLPSPAEVAKDFAELVGLRPQAPQAPVQQVQAQEPAPVVVQKAEKPVITQVKAKSASPVKTQVRSIDDLKKLRQQMTQ